MTLDAEACRDRACALHREARALLIGVDVELYVRSSVRCAATRNEGLPEIMISRGREDGLAIRVRDRVGGSDGFAAASGCDSDALRWAVASASAGPRSAARAPRLGPLSKGAEITDLERAEDLPDSERVLSCLDGIFGDGRPGRVRGESSEEGRMFRVEVGYTVEVLVTESGAVMLRTRNRAWGVVMVEHRPDGQVLSRPRFAVAARLKALDFSLWPGVLFSGLAEGRVIRLSSSPGLVHFDARSSATLVEALINALHRRETALRAPVGPAWKVLHDPCRVDAPFRAKFDDAGFPTRERVLADGRHVIALIGCEGWLRRASFRDPPSAEISCPVLETVGGVLTDGLLVTDVRVHPARQFRWRIEGIGFRIESGSVVDFVGEVGFSATADEMVRRCVAAVGPPMAAANGVITPGLTFDGLELDRS